MERGTVFEKFGCTRKEGSIMVDGERIVFKDGMEI